MGSDEAQPCSRTASTEEFSRLPHLNYCILRTVSSGAEGGGATFPASRYPIILPRQPNLAVHVSNLRVQSQTGTDLPICTATGFASDFSNESFDSAFRERPQDLDAQYSVLRVLRPSSDSGKARFDHRTSNTGLPAPVTARSTQPFLGVDDT